MLAVDGPTLLAREDALAARAVGSGEMDLFHDVLYDAEAAMSLFFFAGLAVCCLRPEPEPAASRASAKE